MRKTKRIWKRILLGVLNLLIFFGPIFQLFPYTTTEVEAANGWCPDAPHEGMSMICGTVYSATKELNTDNLYTDNLPKTGVTVAIYEKNAISSTGQIYGQLTNLFSSTETNEVGRYAIPVRKMGTPDNSAFLVFMCQGNVVAMKQINTHIDQTEINAQIAGCVGEMRYKTPAVPLSYTSRGNSLSCENNVTGEDFSFTPSEVGGVEGLVPDEDGNEFRILEKASTPIGLTGFTQPTINAHLREDNFDLRHASNFYDVNGLGSILDFTTAGGYREQDCVINLARNAGRSYSENLLGPLDSNALTYHGLVNTVEDGAELSYLCNIRHNSNFIMEQTNFDDYITRNYFPFIPKGAGSSDELPYRKLEYRVDVVAAIMDPKAGKQAFDVLAGGGGAGDEKVRMAGAEVGYIQDYLPSCERFRDANDPGIGISTSNVDRQSAAGQTYLWSPVQVEEVFDEALAILGEDIEAMFCTHPDFVYANEFDEEENNLLRPIRLCEIQPGAGPDSKCFLGYNCPGDPNGTGSATDTVTGCKYLLGKEYFRIENYLYSNKSYYGGKTEGKNDSVSGDLMRVETFDVTNAALTEGMGVRAGNRIINNDSKAVTAGLLAASEEFLEEKHKYSGYLENPTKMFDYEEDYYFDLLFSVPIVTDISVPKSLCVLDNVYKHDGENTTAADITNRDSYGIISRVFARQKEENAERNIEFTGNSMHATSLIAATGVFYSTPAMTRDNVYTQGGINPNFQYAVGDIVTRGSLGALAVNEGERTLLPRSITDSMLSIIGGDSRLNTQNNVVNVNISSIIGRAFNSITRGGGIYKSFGEEVGGHNVAAKDYYPVSYPLTEQDFLGAFPIPQWSSGFFPSSWGNNGCYPWNRVPFPSEPTFIENIIDDRYSGNDNRCFTWKDSTITDPGENGRSYEISSTCRVDSCELNNGSVSCVCTYDSDNGQFTNSTCRSRTVDDFRTRIVGEQCSTADRATCADNQYTCYRPTREGENSGDRDRDIAKCLEDTAYRGAIYSAVYGGEDGAEGGIRNFQCPETSPIDWEATNIALETGNLTEGSYIYEETITESRGIGMPTCVMSKAGPLVCNGDLEIGDFAVRIIQDNPISFGYETIDGDGNESTINIREGQKNLDKISLEMAKLIDQYRSPVDTLHLTTKGMFYDVRTSNDPYRQSNQVDKYTSGKLSVTFGTDPVNYKRVSASPGFYINTPLNPVYYHCPNMDIETPEGGTLDTEMYTGSRAILPDPDEDGIIGWACKIYIPPTEEPEYTGVGLCGISSCAGEFSNVTQEFFDIINTAANKTNVPADLIMAAMVGEGHFNNEFLPYWENDVVVEGVGRNYWSRTSNLGLFGIKGSLFGDDLVWTAMGPFSILGVYTERLLRTEVMGSRTTCDLINEVQPGRCQQYRVCDYSAVYIEENPGCKEFHTPSRNNLLDAAFMAATALKEIGYDNPGTGLDCTDITYAQKITALRRFAIGYRPDTELAQGIEAHAANALERVSVCR